MILLLYILFLIRKRKIEIIYFTQKYCLFSESEIRTHFLFLSAYHLTAYNNKPNTYPVLQELCNMALEQDMYSICVFFSHKQQQIFNDDIYPFVGIQKHKN